MTFGSSHLEIFQPEQTMSVMLPDISGRDKRYIWLLALLELRGLLRNRNNKN